MKVIINGKEIEHKDVVIHNTKTTFEFWDRVRILFGSKVNIYSRIYTDHDHCIVLGSESTTRVDKLIITKPKHMGGLESGELNKEEIRDIKINKILK